MPRPGSTPQDVGWVVSQPPVSSESGFDDPHVPLTSGLTLPQRQAVEHFEGPLLVLAGPGSGKTRVITRRIARLVSRGVAPWNILAITFTNKAAREMAARVETLLPGQRVWVSTFHRFCARLLRQYGEAVGLKAGFSIYDTSDQHQVLKRVIDELDFDAVHYSPSRIGHLISREKNNLVTAEQYAQGFQETIGDHTQAVVAKVYPAYQRALLEANAVDFDDLLLHVAVLFRENPDLRSELDHRYQFILVDEYQDTNLAQYEIVANLSRDLQNLCVTGDPDQSIYSWRGAQIGNILRFESDFPQAKVVRLEQNFRSTGLILRAADQLIAHNQFRKAKSLLTDKPDGHEVELLTFADGVQEAEWIAREIRRQVDEEDRQWSDFAVFYRVNALSRELETAFRRERVPYQVAGSVAFYERAEVKDVLAFLRLVQNPQDEVAFLRVVNTPVRGIGKSSLVKLRSWAARKRLSLLDAASQARQFSDLPKKAAAALEHFAAIIRDISLADAGSVAALMSGLLERTGYLAELKASRAEQDLQRLANVQELVSAAAQYDQSAGDERSLEGFLEGCALVSDTDTLSSDAGQVTLMTLHSAKGLEFPVVFIVAVENGLLPHERATKSEDPREYEEERRLLFVGVTRAEERLSVTQTVMRAIRGRLNYTIPSDFLSEMPLRTRDLSGPGALHPGTLIMPRDVDPFADDHDCVDPPHIDEVGEAYEGQELDDNAADFDPASFADQPPPPPQTTPRSRSSSRRERSAAARSPGRAVPSTMMTAAELLQKQAASENDSLSFREGSRVRHPRYGVGTVMAVNGSGRWQSVVVQFDLDARVESFIASKAPLQPIGLP